MTKFAIHKTITIEQKMTEETLKRLAADTDGLLTYEYMANHMGECDADMPVLVANMIRADRTGQFTVSAARYLHATDPDKFAAHIDTLVRAAIDKDRERAYLGLLLSALYGADHAERAAELTATDDNYRRIAKRLAPQGI